MDVSVRDMKDVKSSLQKQEKSGENKINGNIKNDKKVYSKNKAELSSMELSVGSTLNICFELEMFLSTQCFILRPPGCGRYYFCPNFFSI